MQIIPRTPGRVHPHVYGEIAKFLKCKGDVKMQTKTQIRIAEMDRLLETKAISQARYWEMYAEFPYSVNAGRYDYDGEDSKYGESFVCLEDAIAAREAVKGYPWSRIELRDGNYIYEIDPVRSHRKCLYPDGVVRYNFCLPDGGENPNYPSPGPWIK